MARLTSFTLENFRSYKKATLKLGSLTLLVGANAAGKSNVVEGLQMLSWLARGQRLEDVFRAVHEAELSIRGRLVNLPREGSDSFSFSSKIRIPEWNKIYVSIKAGENGLKIIDETISDPHETVPLYDVKSRAQGSGHDLSIAYNNFKQGGKKPQIACTNQQAVFTQLLTPARFAHFKSRKTIPEVCKIWMSSFQNILFLDPTPSKMRGYSFLIDKKLKGDGSNISSCLYALCKDAQRCESVLNFVKDLPEQDISEIGFLEGPRSEVMVQLAETFGKKKKWRDASLLSDGTLRVLAMAAALLAAPKFSTVVMEEIDNGIHPSRANALLKSVEAIAEERKLAVLITSHNPAMLDAIPVNSIPDVVFCYRDPEEGDSRLLSLADLPNYPELIAQGPLGKLVTQGILDRMVKSAKSPDEQRQSALQYLAKLRKASI